MKRHLVLSEFAAKGLTIMNVTVSCSTFLDVLSTCVMYQSLLLSEQSQETCGPQLPKVVISLLSETVGVVFVNTSGIIF